MDAIRHTIELGGRSDPEAVIVVAVVRVVVVAVRHAAVLRVVVPGAAAKNAVRALMAIDQAVKVHFFLVP